MNTSNNQKVPWYHRKVIPVSRRTELGVIIFLCFAGCFSFLVFHHHQMNPDKSLEDFNRWNPDGFLTRNLQEAGPGQADLDRSRIYVLGHPSDGWKQYRTYLLENHQASGWKLDSETPDRLTLTNANDRTFQVIWKDDKVRIQNWVE